MAKLEKVDTFLVTLHPFPKTNFKLHLQKPLLFSTQYILSVLKMKHHKKPVNVSVLWGVITHITTQQTEWFDEWVLGTDALVSWKQ